MRRGEHTLFGMLTLEEFVYLVSLSESVFLSLAAVSRRRSSCSRSPSTSLHIKAILFVTCASSPPPSAHFALRQERRALRQPYSAIGGFVSLSLRVPARRSETGCRAAIAASVVLRGGPAAISWGVHLLRCRQGQEMCVLWGRQAFPPQRFGTKRAG